MTDWVKPQLYLVSPPRFEPKAFAAQVRAALGGGPIACLQLWMPDASDDDIRSAATLVLAEIKSHDTAFLLNGNAKLATYLGCDGVHLDTPDVKAVKAAKKILGDDAIVGVSCGTSRHTSMDVAEAGADYVSFGPIYDTATKELAAAPGALDTLTWWAEMMEVPCVAVGGLTPQNLDPVLDTRCEFICAVSAVWNHPDGPAAAVHAFHKAFESSEV
ncbi:MAG: thiamine phosphate synthase [Alphaproteobacteria bacterium]|nr:thiamine phosphate synthase [Alphaproteobacteria bacterium]